jgi:hypothetical protein
MRLIERHIEADGNSRGRGTFPVSSSQVVRFVVLTISVQ